MGGHLSIYRLGIPPLLSLLYHYHQYSSSVKHIQIVGTIERECDLYSVCPLVCSFIFSSLVAVLEKLDNSIPL